MKNLILSLALCLSACGQNKPTPAKPKASTETKPVKISEGMPCLSKDLAVTTSSGNFGYMTAYYSTDSATWIEIPFNEIWDCENSKWHHDKAAEEKQEAHFKFVQGVRDAIIIRRLRKDEVEVIREALAPYAYSYGFGYGYACSGDGCLERQQCEATASQTAALVAQLEFWKPTEEELPLSLLQSYVKGMNCNSGTDRAYQIMNDRIIGWLSNQARLVP